MPTPASELERTWIIAAVWSEMHRERNPSAAQLEQALEADSAEQLLALGQAAWPDPQARDRVLAGLQGTGLPTLLAEVQLGGIRWADLIDAPPADARDRALDLAADCLEELKSPAAPMVRQARGRRLPVQLCLLWKAWTFPALDAFDMALVALVQAVLLGRMDEQSLSFVIWRHQGLA
ncbi:MAG: hypothetical protein GY913_04260 [Proteobacteria bacterium]|nr:hypothetical protein [Pseudomonadota bacterium]